jgi:FtsP/CotA-like multicopper oxidase with cupredoxin domain
MYVPTHRRGIAYTPEQPILTLVPPAVPGPTALPAHLGEWTPFDVASADIERDIVLSLFNICGRFMNPDRVDVHARSGAREIWRVRNVDVMDHPFHLHTWHYEVLDVNGRPPPYRARFDMLNVREGAVARLGIHFAGHTGRTLYHCHFAEHADSGMMAVLQVD